MKILNKQTAHTAFRVKNGYTNKSFITADCSEADIGTGTMKCTTEVMAGRTLEVAVNPAFQKYQYNHTTLVEPDEKPSITFFGDEDTLTEVAGLLESEWLFRCYLVDWT